MTLSKKDEVKDKGFRIQDGKMPKYSWSDLPFTTYDDKEIADNDQSYTTLL